MTQQTPPPSFIELPQPLRKTRVTLLTKLYHEVPGEQPDAPTHTPYVELLATEEQAYERSVKVGTDWQPIDFGWTAESGCSFLNVKNVFRARRTTEPSEAEREEDASHVLEIGKLIVAPKAYPAPDHIEPLFALYVGQETVISPLGQDRYMIRCRNADGKYYVFCVPSDPE